MNENEWVCDFMSMLLSAKILVFPCVIFGIFIKFYKLNCTIQVRFGVILGDNLDFFV